MSLVENLLLNLDPKKSNVKFNSNDNFLLHLLDTYKNEPEKLSDILKNLNINANDLKKFENRFNKLLSTKQSEYTLFFYKADTRWDVYK